MVLTAGYQHHSRRTLYGPVLINTTKGRGGGHLSSVSTLMLVPPSRSSLPPASLSAAPTLFLSTAALANNWIILLIQLRSRWLFLKLSCGQSMRPIRFSSGTAFLPAQSKVWKHQRAFYALDLLRDAVATGHKRIKNR